MFSRVFNEPITIGLLSCIVECDQSQGGFYGQQEGDRRHHANPRIDLERRLVQFFGVLN